MYNLYITLDHFTQKTIKIQPYYRVKLINGGFSENDIFKNKFLLEIKYNVKVLYSKKCVVTKFLLIILWLYV